MNQPCYHISIAPEQGAPWALIAGDPGRVPAIAAYLDTSWVGTLAGQRVLVMSHGIGGPSTAICVEELAQCGVHTLIRVGTCGGMQQQVLAGDLVAATGAIRAEGTSREYLPVEFPAVADVQVVQALLTAANAAARRGGICRAVCVSDRLVFRGPHAHLQPQVLSRSGHGHRGRLSGIRNGIRHPVYCGGGQTDASGLPAAHAVEPGAPSRRAAGRAGDGHRRRGAHGGGGTAAVD